VEKCLKKGIRMRIIGDRSILPPEMIQKMNDSEEKTAHLHYNLNVAINYGSRAEICHAVNSLIAEGKTQITEADISSRLYTAPVGDPDLIIRTGGEIRLSNYLMWQASYAEFYFTDTLWPDFGKKDLYKAFHKFAKTHRRFGGL
jgi:undecaprenyl diphosphate synthase